MQASASTSRLEYQRPVNKTAKKLSRHTVLPASHAVCIVLGRSLKSDIYVHACILTIFQANPTGVSPGRIPFLLVDVLIAGLIAEGAFVVVFIVGPVLAVAVSNSVSGVGRCCCRRS